MVNRVLLVSILFTRICSADDYYVATNGSDAVGVPGTLAQPFATLSNAVSRSVALTGWGYQKNIYICAGDYYNTAVKATTGQFTNGNMLICAYTNGVTLWGGQLLTGWTTNGDGTYTASLGDFPPIDTDAAGVSTWQPRTLVADGQRVNWAEYPDANLGGTNKLYFANDPNANLSSITYTNTLENSTNLELCIDNSWNDAQVEVTAINTGTKVLTLSETVNHITGQNGADVRTYTVRNNADGLINPNSFFWDKTNSTIIFKPPTGKYPSSMKVVVPSTSRILWIAGTYNASLISNVIVSNITFSCSTAPLAGGIKRDAGQGYEGALSIMCSTNCSIDKCIVYGSAGCGIEGGWSASGYNNGLKIANCIVHDCGSGGISIRGNGGDNIISNNLVYNIFGTTKRASGIVSANGYIGRTNYVISNTITNCDGAAIYIGSGNDCVISYNWIQRCMKQLRDMGAIYFIDASNFIVINNLISDTYPTNSLNGGIWDPFVIGIYCDEGTTNQTIASNIVYNCTRFQLFNDDHASKWINNVFINKKPSPYDDSWMNWHGEGPLITFQKNIFLTQGGTKIRVFPDADTNLVVADWHSNIIWSVTAQNGANPTNATSEDPLFVKVPSSTPQWLNDIDLSFQAGSPAPALGIQPLTIAGIGYNGGLKWRNAGYVTNLNVRNIHVGGSP